MFDIGTLIEIMSEVDGSGCSDAELVDQIAGLERLKSAAAAAQARLTARFDASQRSAAGARGVRTSERGRGIAEQVALARRESPTMGHRHVGMAKALVHEMPHTLAALAAGETAALSRESRAQVDAELGPQLGGLGDKQVAARARAAGYRLEPESLVRRIARAEGDRCVTIRPAPDCMTYLTALLPVAQGVAVYAALRKHADTVRGSEAAKGAHGTLRGSGQLMADALVQRTTGLAEPDKVPVEIQLVMTDRSMVGLDDEPGVLRSNYACVTPDVGTVPAWLGRRIVRTADRAWIRRVWATPTQRQLISCDATRRLFPRGLQRLIATRDQYCRTPWCGAPIRHTDHIVEASRGGTTTAGNGEGLCERCNLLSSRLGWSRAPDRRTGPTRVVITTPTGHSYDALAPPPPSRAAEPRPPQTGSMAWAG